MKKNLHFEFIERVTQIKRYLIKTQFELVHNTLGVMAGDLTDIKNSFHQGRHCSVHAQMQSNQIWMSSFSSSCGLPIGVTHTINLRFSTSQANIWTKNKNCPGNSSNITFHMAPNQFELSTLKCIFAPKFVVPSHLK